MTGVTPRNEQLAQSEVECREGKHPHDVRVLFCPWNMHLHLAVQTCVRQRKPRLLGMGAFDGVCRFQVRGTIRCDIASLDPPSGALPKFNRCLPGKNRQIFLADKGLPPCSSPLHPPPRQKYCAKCPTQSPCMRPFFSPLRSVNLFLLATRSRTLLSGLSPNRISTSLSSFASRQA